MVNALVQINENANRVLNIIKAKYGLKDKSEAINIMAEQYENEMLEPELRPEFVEKIKKTEHLKGVKFKSIDELRYRYK